ARVAYYPSIPSSSTLTACPGRSVGFSAEYHQGTEPRTFQWRKNGVNIPGANNSFFIINSVSAADAGSYDYVISNACGTETSSPATLDVYSFSLNPTSQNFSASGS